MADIELVIKISEDTYKDIIENGFIYDEDNEVISREIKNGIPVPKGHGKIIDESKITKCGWNFIDHHAKTDAPTIVEADKEVQDADSN